MAGKGVSGEKKTNELGDSKARKQIKTVVDRNILVEAAAGTGKTTGMVERMVALLAGGMCETDELAAVTFTRKAAAELRSRFQVALEKAAVELTGQAGGNARRALSQIDRAFIGTIHSFCARLLRERPVEAGVDLDFSEIEDEDDLLLRSEAWQLYAAGLIADDPGGVLPEIERLGLDLGELEGAFLKYADYPDVDEWPHDAKDDPSFEEEVRGALDYSARMSAHLEKLPRRSENDRLIPKYKKIPRIVSHLPGLDEPRELYELLLLFDSKPGAVQKVWIGTGNYDREQVKQEEAKWEKFREMQVEPVLKAWREARYGAIMQVMSEARGLYDRMRKELGVLNFADLLTRAAELLRENPHVREYFQGRYTHLLVDEFQDTDPVQAEVMLLLTSSDTAESDYTWCVPRPGSLFVVGDPKQSIYRFRRADIEVYNEVKKIIEDTGGLVLQLYSNFRSTGPLIDWINDLFRPGADEAPDGPMLAFPENGTAESPAYIPLEKGLGKEQEGEFGGLYELVIPEDYAGRGLAVEYEADMIARTICDAMYRRLKLTRACGGTEGGTGRKLDYSDFLIITRTKADLGVYAAKLDALGIPNQVTGGSSLSDSVELKLLHSFLLAALRPDDPVALIASLRSELFGVSDACLYAYKKAGGSFNYRAGVPKELEESCARAIDDTFNFFREASMLLSRLPAAAAIGETVSLLGLEMLAGSHPGGDVCAGGLMKALEVLRALPSGTTWGAAQVAEYLGDILEGKVSLDGISAGMSERPAVRIMNLHKAKGLEAPVVFLANPYGDSGRDPDFHVERIKPEDHEPGHSNPDGGRSKARGYLLAQKKINDYTYSRIAQPSGWDEVAEREKRFTRAEELRLRYVAVTRAGSALIISRKAKRDMSNPWRHFNSYLGDAKPLPDPGDVTAKKAEEIAVTPEDFHKAEERIGERMQAVLDPTYDIQRAKEYALGAGTPGAALETGPAPEKTAAGTGGEHGMEWGTVIHALLELAMNQPEADLEAAAKQSLEENGLDRSLAGEAAHTVRSVMASDTWKRAASAEHVMTEVPFEILLDPGAEKPTLIRGAIDLAFREEQGWTIIDYKTDSLEKNTEEELRARYAPQLEIYKHAWEQATGEPVLMTDLLLIDGNK